MQYKIGIRLKSAFRFWIYFAANLYFRLLIVFFPFSKLKRSLAIAAGPDADPSTARWVGRYVFHTAQYVPYSTCVSRALTAHFFLRRKGLSSLIRVGVASKGNSVVAHAWVLSGSEVVVGNEAGELDEYAPIADMGTHHS